MKMISKTTIATLALVAVFTTSAAAAEYRGTMFSSGTAAKPASQKFLAVAECVQSVQSYWPKRARLFLKSKGYIRNVTGTQVIVMNGWVWHQGTRKEVSHECTAANGSDRVALRVMHEDTLIAQAH